MAIEHDCVVDGVTVTVKVDTGPTVDHWRVTVTVPAEVEGRITALSVVVRDDGSPRWAELVSLALHGHEQGWESFARTGLALALQQSSE